MLAPTTSREAGLTPDPADRAGPLICRPRRDSVCQFRCAPAPRMSYSCCRECGCKRFEGSGLFCGMCEHSFWAHW